MSDETEPGYHNIAIGRTGSDVLLRVDGHDVWMSPEEALEIGTLIRDMALECMGQDAVPKGELPS